MLTVVEAVPTTLFGVVLVSVDVEDEVGVARVLLSSLEDVPGVSARGGVGVALVIIDHSVKARAEAARTAGVDA